MVGESHVFVAQGGNCGHHGLDGVAAITPFAVQVQIAAEVAGLDQLGEAAIEGRVQLPHTGAQFRRDPGQAEAGVERLLIGENFHVAGLDVGDAVLVEGQALAVGEIAQADVVLLAAGEILEHGTDGLGFAGAQVDLDSWVDDDAGLAGAIDQHFLHLGQSSQAAAQFLALRRDGDQVHVADGLLPAAQAAGGRQQSDAVVAFAQAAITDSAVGRA